MATRALSVVGRLFTTHGAGLRTTKQSSKKRQLVQSYQAQAWLLWPFVLW